MVDVQTGEARMEKNPFFFFFFPVRRNQNNLVEDVSMFETTETQICADVLINLYLL